MIKLKKVEDEKDYIKKYAMYEQEMEEQRINYIEKNNFLDFKSYFDDLTGGIIVPDYIWNVSNNSIKRIYEERDEVGKYKYILHANEGVILRGAKTYYYLLAHKGMYEKVDEKHIFSWLDNYSDFFSLIFSGEIKIESLFDKMCILGVLDNVRNFFLNALTLYIYSVNEDRVKDSILILENDDYNLMRIVNSLRNLYKEYELTMILNQRDINFINKISKDIEDIKQIIKNILQKNKGIAYDLGFRSYRELDSFFEVYVTVKKYIETMRIKKYAIGIMQGGIEVPVVLSTFNSMHYTEVGFLHLYGNFKERHQNNEVTNRQLYSKEYLSDYVLCDENILTGNTLLIASKLLNRVGEKVDDYLVVRRLGSNRIYHLLSYKECIDIEYCRENIQGMMFCARYTKIKKSSNIMGMYYNELFQFDLAKERVYELLFLNGVYSVNSRIACYSNLERALEGKIRK